MYNEKNRSLLIAVLIHVHTASSNASVLHRRNSRTAIELFRAIVILIVPPF